jgi:lysyl-tRNA synthetase class 2
MEKIIRGRIVRLSLTELTLQTETQYVNVQSIESISSLSIGDIVEVQGRSVQLLTPNRTPNKTWKWLSRTLDPRRLHAVTIRGKVEQGIRDFFFQRDFRETRTPLLVPCPGMEPHIRPLAVQSTYSKVNTAYLPTSPEFAMKRLLVGGLERIFQICPAFRDEPHSTTHLPEFTMLEWYRAYAGYEVIMEDTEKLFEHLAIQLFGKPEIPFQGRTISVKTPWPRLRVRDLFMEMTGIDLVKDSTIPHLMRKCHDLGIQTSQQDTWDDLYFRVWLNIIEPKLPADQAIFVTRYPASQAALAVIDTDADGSRWARRFEVYAGGLELGNAFEELTDPIEQRNRFIDDMRLRTELYGPSFPQNPLDESFLEALTEGMPPSGGIAVGVDRMVMLYANESDIAFTTWLPLERLSE